MQIVPRYPFHQLAILAHDKGGMDESNMPHMTSYKDASSHASSMVDSRLSLNSSSQDDGSLSRNGSLAFTGSVGLPSKASGLSVDSKRSLQNSSSFGSNADSNPNMKSVRSNQSLADQPIIEGREGVQSSVPTIPETPTSKKWADIDKVFNSSNPQSSARKLINSAFSSHSTGELEDTPKAKAKDPRRSSIAGPFAHFRCNRKKKSNKQQCRWDMFPGISVCERNPRALPPHHQSNDSPPATRRDLTPSYIQDKQQYEDKMYGGDQSPRGPLSVDLSEEGATARSDPQDDELARTFDLRDLESAEQDASGSDSSGNWRADSSSAQQTQQSKAESAPVASGQVKEQPPPRSSTFPQLGSLQSVKDTAKLRVEKFRGIVFVNEYALVRTLGKGSFGKVKLGLNTHDHNLYALKLIPKSRRKFRGNPSGAPLVAEAEVIQEINVMKGLDHPNIVRLVEVIDDPANNKLLMVLEYVEGGSLFAGTKISPKKRLTELSARKYFRDVLQGLDYLHSHKIAHGDLKPDNLLLGANGHVKIADFGSSQLTRVGDLVNRTAGTPAFMAPEMCSGEPYHARLADIWALGVCLYMSIFGTVPFKSDSILGLYNEIRSTPLTFPDHIFVSDSMKHLLLRLLDKDPENRISLTSAMCHQWVTHNGAYPLPNIQGLEPDEEEDPDAYLMECWPDDPADIGLESVLKTVGPLFEQRIYPDGGKLARQGDPAHCIYFIEEGTVNVMHTMVRDATVDSDEEEEEEVAPEEGDKRKRLKRQGSMLKTMFCATVRASRLVSAVRSYANGETTTLACRGPGSFIGEVMVYESAAANAKWQTCVVARGPVKVLVLNYRDMKDLVSKRPEVEADLRAVMAQRKGELLKMEMLERLAGLHRELRNEVEIASNARGASLSAIEVARQMLGCNKSKEQKLADQEAGNLPQADPGYMCNEGSEIEKRSMLKSLDNEDLPEVTEQNGSLVEKDSSNSQETTSSSEAMSTSTKVPCPFGCDEIDDLSRDSINVKGDSAKTLSAFPGGKAPAAEAPKAETYQLP